MITLTHIQIAMIFIGGILVGVFLSYLYFKRALIWAMDHGRAYLYSDTRGWTPKHPHQHSYNDVKDIHD